MLSTLRRPLLLALVAASLVACKGDSPPLVMNAKEAGIKLDVLKGTGHIKGKIKPESGTFPAGARLMLTMKEVGKNDFPFSSFEDGGIYTSSIDLTADASAVPFEISDLSDGQYRLKSIVYLDLKSRLTDPVARKLRAGDFAGVYTGGPAPSQDLKQAKPIEIKGDQTVEVVLPVSKMP